MNEATKGLIKQVISNPEVRAAMIQKVTSPETQAAIKKQLKKKSKGNLKDQWVDFKYWSKLWAIMLSTNSPDKEKMGEASLKYPWMIDFMKTNHMVKMYNEGRTGTALKMNWMVNIENTKFTIKMLQNVILDPDNTVMAQVMVPTQIYHAMGLNFFTIEQPAGILAMMDQHSHLHYMDFIQNCGLPDDTCSYTSQTPGIVLSGHMPVTNTCIVSSNLPCESGAISYSILEDYFGLPTYRLDVPYDFKSADGIKTYVEDLKGLIAFLEEHTGHTMDWDKLKEICDRENEITQIEMERFELQRTAIPPVPGDVLWQSHLMYMSGDPGQEEGLELFKKLQKLWRKAYYFKEPGVKNMKYRVVLWNPPSFGYAHMWNWLERCWGIGIINDMETFSQMTMIDTSSRESIIEGLAEHMCNAPMSRHNRGPAENWMEDLNLMTTLYRPDFILNMNQMSCRSSLAMTGAMKEWGREKDLPICFVDFNLYDNRVVSRQGQRDQVNNFMLNVMKATPLDESLLVFDDSQGW